MTAEETPNAEFSMVRNASLSTRIILNVGGERHDVPWETLARFPNSRLGRLKDCRTHEELRTLCDDYSFKENEYYFNWQPGCFRNILQYYRTGRLHVNGEVCALSFDEDLKYWELNDSCLASCCQGKHLQEIEDLKDEMRNLFILMNELKEKEFGIHGRSKFENDVWNLLENPKSSLKARVLQCVSIIFIFIAEFFALWNMSNGRYTFKGGPFIVFILECACTIWFIFEYLLRICFAPKKRKHFTGVLNIIDFLLILQNFVSLILLILLHILYEFAHTWQSNSWSEEISIGIYTIENIRILTILKLSRYLEGFRILGLTLFRSSKILGMLMLFLLLGIVTFSSLIYFEREIHWAFYNVHVPQDENMKVRSISDAAWWSTVAMISSSMCGSGECPSTTSAKIIAALCVLCGVVVVTLPIPIIINNFSECFKIQRMQEIISKHHQIKTSERGDSYQDLQ